jgi:transcriptional regulator with XRE-family HTH domain
MREDLGGIMSRADDAAGTSNALALIKRIDDLRDGQRISKVNFSLRAGYAQKYWSDVTNGRLNPSLSAFCDHAEVLGLSFYVMRRD